MTDETSNAGPLGATMSRITEFLGTISAIYRMIAIGLVAAVFVLIFAAALIGGDDNGRRAITINGQRMTGEQVAYLDTIAGGPVPDGNYWLDPQTGIWGIVGNPQPMGQIGGGGPGTPHWADVGQNYRGPFGDYMSDGQGCSAVNGILVGNC